MQTAGCMFWWVGWLLVDKISKWLDVNFCRLLLLHNRYSFETEGTMLYISLCHSWRMTSKYWAQALVVGWWHGAFKAKSKELLAWFSKDLAYPKRSDNGFRSGRRCWPTIGVLPLVWPPSRGPARSYARCLCALSIGDLPTLNTVIMVHDGLVNFWRFKVLLNVPIGQQFLQFWLKLELKARFE